MLLLIEKEFMKFNNMKCLTVKLSKFSITNKVNLIITGVNFFTFYISKEHFATQLKLNNLIARTLKSKH